MNNIDIIYYINLDHRTDRKEQILQELKKMNIPDSKIQRIPGIYTKGFGVLGCAQTHLKTLETFMESNYNNCLILEDDFMFLYDEKTTNYYLDNFFKKIPNFDMCMLGAALHGPCNDTIHPYIKHANGNVSGGSGYIISRSFGPMLIKNISDSSRLLEYVKMVSGHIVTVYCHDIYWRGIQIGTSWYVLNPILGVQRESYSDIAEAIVNKM